MVIARMLLRGGLLTLALASAMAKLLVGLLCHLLRATPNLRGRSERVHSRSPSKRGASAIPRDPPSVAVRERACYEAGRNPAFSGLFAFLLV